MKSRLPPGTRQTGRFGPPRHESFLDKQFGSSSAGAAVTISRLLDSLCEVYPKRIARNKNYKLSTGYTTKLVRRSGNRVSGASFPNARRMAGRSRPIQDVYEVDPLVCSHRVGTMRVEGKDFSGVAASGFEENEKLISDRWPRASPCADARSRARSVSARSVVRAGTVGRS